MNQGRVSRRAAQVARSQLAVRLGLAVYAALCTAILLRCVVLLLQWPASVWSVKTILTLSAPIVLPLGIVPAASRPIIGSATLADLTAAIVLVALTLPLFGRGIRG
jgi:hypothetical protein